MSHYESVEKAISLLSHSIKDDCGINEEGFYEWISWILCHFQVNTLLQNISRNIVIFKFHITLL